MAGPADERLAAIPAGLRRLMSFCGEPPDMSGPGFVSWIFGWGLMVLAMMLPPTLPLLRTADRLLSKSEDRVALIALMLLAFVGVWIVAGVLLFMVGSGLRVGLNALPENMTVSAEVAAGVAAIAAGAFQFTRLKMACMDACRSPAAIMMLDWSDVYLVRSALRVGARYGMVCVGCCWAMMMLGLLVGALMLPIMVLCALMMTLERLLPSFRPLIPLQAGFAILIGILLLIGRIPSDIF
jgi:predicted metal-binding membrane protein